MKQLYTLCLAIGILLSANQESHAQDPSFSQFYANRIYLNPAMTGMEAGLSLAGIYRAQWTQVDHGFRTIGASLEWQEPAIRSGLGFSLFRDEEGIAKLATTAVSFSYAYIIPMKNHSIHFGFEGQWVQKSVDWSKIIFSDQLDPVYGVILPTTAIPIVDRVSFGDFKMGFLWRFKTDLNLGKMTFKDTHNSFGLSLHHAPYMFIKNSGNESFQNLNTRTHPRLTAHWGSILPMIFFNAGKRKISISPNIKYDIQGEKVLDFKHSLQVFTYGLYLMYEGFYVGGSYQNRNAISFARHTNALILAVGAYINQGERGRNKKNNFFVGLSYDTNTTGVGPRAGGVFELAFRWTINDAPGIFGSGGSKRSGKRVLDCHNFF